MIKEYLNSFKIPYDESIHLGVGASKKAGSKLPISQVCNEDDSSIWGDLNQLYEKQRHRQNQNGDSLKAKDKSGKDVR